MKRFIVKFNGGLGNQMFQYAFAKGVENKTGMKAMFDMSFFEKRYARPFELSIFGIVPDVAKTFKDKFKIGILWKFRRKLDGKKFLGMKLISEPCFEFCDMDIEPETYIEGFFQTEKYFEGVDIVKEFQFKEPLSGRSAELAKLMAESNSISLHIRRGDYVKKKVYQNMFAHCDMDYYKNAVELITKGDTSFKVFLFSDDIEWVKENLSLPCEMIYVDCNSGKDSYRDMQLMSLCKHNIIANSSFSWWGAYLNTNPEKVVVAPKKWFADESINESDVIPTSWVRM